MTVPLMWRAALRRECGWSAARWGRLVPRMRRRGLNGRSSIEDVRRVGLEEIGALKRRGDWPVRRVEV